MPNDPFTERSPGKIYRIASEEVILELVKKQNVCHVCCMD